MDAEFNSTFRIQRVPTLHTFDGPCYPKNKKYLKKRDDETLPQKVFWGAGSIKSMQCGYSLDAELNFASNDHVFQVFLVFGVEGSIKSM